MYLTKGDLYHSSTWKLWFEYAGGFLPMTAVKEACKDPQLIEKARKLCKRRTVGTGEETLANQHLFNVYVHVGMNNQEFKGKLFLHLYISRHPDSAAISFLVHSGIMNNACLAIRGCVVLLQQAHTVLFASEDKQAIKAATMLHCN